MPVKLDHFPMVGMKFIFETLLPLHGLLKNHCRAWAVCFMDVQHHSHSRHQGVCRDGSVPAPDPIVTKQLGLYRCQASSKPSHSTALASMNSTRRCNAQPQPHMDTSTIGGHERDSLRHRAPSPRTALQRFSTVASVSLALTATMDGAVSP